HVRDPSATRGPGLWLQAHLHGADDLAQTAKAEAQTKVRVLLPKRAAQEQTGRRLKAAATTDLATVTSVRDHPLSTKLIPVMHRKPPGRAYGNLQRKSARLGHLPGCGDGVGHLLAEPNECPLHRGDQSLVTDVVDLLRYHSFSHTERLLLRAALHGHLPSTLQDDRLPGNAIETRDADRRAVGGTARKNAGSPRRNRNLLGCEVFTQAGDERADDLVHKRTPPAVELREDELVCAGAGDDLLPVDVVRNPDGPARQRRVGCSRGRAVADLERRQRVEPGLARASQA